MTIMLEECALEYRVVPVDIGAGEPIAIFESGAILFNQTSASVHAAREAAAKSSGR